MQLVSVNHAHHSVKPKCTFCNRPSGSPLVHPVYSSAFPFEQPFISPCENPSTTQTSYWQLRFSPKKKTK